MRKVCLILLGVVLLGAVAIVALRSSDRGPESFAAIDGASMTAREVSSEGYRLAPAMLLAVYDAFAETQEAAIYDGLAEVAAGDALEQLYLERLGAMVGGGLEPDQEIHEMELIRLDARTSDGRVAMDAKWRVLGTVGHAEHLHVRGNTYAADLVVAPVDGAWRLTAFELTDVDRSDAGTTQLRDDGPSARLGVEAN